MEVQDLFIIVWHPLHLRDRVMQDHQRPHCMLKGHKLQNTSESQLDGNFPASTLSTPHLTMWGCPGIVHNRSRWVFRGRHCLVTVATCGRRALHDKAGEYTKHVIHRMAGHKVEALHDQRIRDSRSIERQYTPDGKETTKAYE